MPRVGPLRRNVGLKLSTAEEAPILAIAEAEHGGNLSAAIRALIVEALTMRTSPPGNTLAISAGGMAALDRLAEREGCGLDEVTRRVLKYGSWKMPPGYTG